MIDFSLLESLKGSFYNFHLNNALHVNNIYYTYSQLVQKISGIEQFIAKKVDSEEKLIGIITHDTFETYSSFIACWFAGYGFVPLNPKNPKDRNNSIIEQTGIKVIFTSKPNASDIVDLPNLRIIDTKLIEPSQKILETPKIDKKQVLCILFTSGSTGIPKGVPMNVQNIEATMDAFFALGYDLNEKDRFLQMFEFTFDMSMLSYLPAFTLGACVYSVAGTKVKYLAAIKTLKEFNITFAAMVPSTLTYIRPYFQELLLDKLKYSVLGGEPFYTHIATEWSRCVPNAQIVNISGPTETTIACMGYNLSKDIALNKAYNGVLAFGRPWKNSLAIVVDEDLNESPVNSIGELCFAGSNVMDGYWKMPDKNKEAFFLKTVNGKEYRFYKTGDMAILDSEGDFLTCGRSDNQVKIQGHKVELSEIETHARNYTGIVNVAAIAQKNEKGFVEIYLFIENYNEDGKNLTEFLKTKVPWYMYPKEIRIVKQFPLNLNGKTDRLALLKLLNNE